MYVFAAVSLALELSIVSMERCVCVCVCLVWVCGYELLWLQVVTPASYQARLESLGILIKAKNFLVFQVHIYYLSLSHVVYTCLENYTFVMFPPVKMASGGLGIIVQL